MVPCIIWTLPSHSFGYKIVLFASVSGNLIIQLPVINYTCIDIGIGRTKPYKLQIIPNCLEYVGRSRVRIQKMALHELPSSHRRHGYCVRLSAVAGCRHRLSRSLRSLDDRSHNPVYLEKNLVVCCLQYWLSECVPSQPPVTWIIY